MHPLIEKEKIETYAIQITQECQESQLEGKAGRR